MALLERRHVTARPLSPPWCQCRRLCCWVRFQDLRRRQQMCWTAVPDEPIYSLCVFGRRLLLGKSTSKEATSKQVSFCKLGWWHHARRGCILKQLKLWFIKYLQQKSRISVFYTERKISGKLYLHWLGSDRERD